MQGKTSDGEEILRVENLRKQYSGDTSAINGISFSVLKGEFFVVMGPSGSGKTTLLKCLAGLLLPDEGRIVLEGNDITELPAHKRGISLIFQDYALFPHMTVAENIAFGLKLKGLSKDEIEREVTNILRIIGLSGYENRNPRQLSGGEKQRVAIARSLVLKPKILLFDEPLANLDYRLQRRMEEELKLLHQELGLTFIYVTHNQEQAMSLGDRIMIINKGLIEQIGKPDELYFKPRNVFTARFLGEVNLIRGKALSIEGNYVKVETRFGILEGRCWDSVKAGSDVTYAIRPEFVRMFRGKTGGRLNSIKGRFLSIIYRGIEAEGVMLLEDGTRFSAIIPGQDALRMSIKQDEEIESYWSSDDAFVLTETSAVPGADIESLVYGQ